MKKSIRKITILFLSLVLIINASLFTLQAKGNKKIKNKDEVYAENLEKIKEYENLSVEELAKKNGITVEHLEKVQKLSSNKGRTVNLDVYLRAVGCPYCQEGKLINTGKRCLPWHTTGQQRECDDYAYGYDVEYERTCEASKKCDVCGYEYTTKDWKETNWKCFGTNDPGKI